MNKPREIDTSLLDELRALLGDRVTTSRAIREHHGKDESYYPYALPDAVTLNSLAYVVCIALCVAIDTYPPCE